MTLQDLGNLGEFIGGLAVIATLLYLAVQVRQNTQLLRANALAASSAANVSFNHILGSDPAVARVFQLGLENFTSLPEEEQRQFLSLLRGLFTAHEHVFQQYEHGLVGEEVWHQNRRMALGVLALPHVRVWWEHRKDVFHASFSNAMLPGGPVAIGVSQVPSGGYPIANELLEFLQLWEASPFLARPHQVSVGSDLENSPSTRQKNQLPDLFFERG